MVARFSRGVEAVHSGNNLSPDIPPPPRRCAMLVLARFRPRRFVVLLPVYKMDGK